MKPPHLTASALAVGFALSPLAHAADPVTVHVFHDDAVHFLPDDPDRYSRDVVGAGDDGRVVRRRVELTPPDGPCRVIARVVTRPIAKDVRDVHDRWDRAGNVRLVPEAGPAVEIVRFVTAYGGVTDHEVDVTHLAPLLRGACTIEGWIDTWISPAWRMDVRLTYLPIAARPDTVDRILDRPLPPADWALAAFYYESLDHETLGTTGVGREITVPEELARVTLYYLVSGHCTDGRGADEFESKANVIRVDGEEVHRFEPWREDCRDFRAVNPYCRRWSDGSWSADYSRSGWCPGDWVRPETIDLTRQLADGGAHTIGVMIENVRPKDESGHGYWRVSGVLAGWREDPQPQGDGS